MQWLRRSRAQRALPVRRNYRPELDALEHRRLMNVSSIFNSAGILTTYIVDQPSGSPSANNLTRFDNHGAHVLNVRPGLPSGVTVRNAHAYLDARGVAAVDVVFSDGQAWQSDSRGSRHFADNVLEMSTIITTAGVKNFFLFADAGTTPPFGPDKTGTLIVSFHGVNTTLDTEVRWASAFVAANGQVGLAKGKIVAGNLVVTRKLGAVTRTLYNSPDGATQDITAYSEASFNGQTVIDFTFGRFAGTYDLRFRQNTVTMLGTGTSIQVGG
jgi:hypothetical protein